MRKLQLFLGQAILLPFVCFVSGAQALVAQGPAANATQSGEALDVMPLPAHCTRGAGSLLLDDGIEVVFHGYTEPRMERARERMLVVLGRETGILKWKKRPQERVQFVVETKGPSAPVQQVGEDESYHLEISPSSVLLRAANPLGVLRGFQTFLQLVHSTPAGFSVHALTIEDAPRFPWRGLMIDSGRHFMPPEIIRQNLDAMEAVKLNVLHWHVSEDQGFRIESKVFPKLQGMGSDGSYYTQQQVKEIVEYARDRGIRVYPEFEMPSHAASFYVGYPELADGTGPYHLKRKFGEKWGRPRTAAEDSSMNPIADSTYAFLDRLMGEMATLFPDRYWHIGGDSEDAMTEWATNATIKRGMQQKGIKDNAALQAYFTGRQATLLAKHGKTPIGWDEVLQPGTSKDVVIQSWRGLDSLRTAAQSGHHVILSWGYYLDLNEPASRHYAVDPLGKPVNELDAAQQKLVMGGETAMWTEYVSPETFDGRIWPRAAAVAERLWSSAETKDVDSMYARLPRIARFLTATGVPFEANRERLYQRIAGDRDDASLKVLASIVEPPKGFPRETDREYDVYTPLNHLSDVIPAESDAARTFRDGAKRVAAGMATQADRDKLRRELMLLRDNDAALQPVLQGNSVGLELVPLSRNASRVAAIGLAALDAIESHKPLRAEGRQGYVDELKALGKPVAELTIMVVPGVESLLLAPSTPAGYSNRVF